MIDGLKLKVPFAQLETHLKGRAKYHTLRADEKERDLPALAEAVKMLADSEVVNEDDVEMFGKASNTALYRQREDAVQRLREDIVRHRRKAAVFLYFSEHLFAEDYTLDEDDLRRLEIVE